MISVLLPTTGRCEMAERSVVGLLETTAGHDIEIIATVDADGATAIALNELGCTVDWSADYRGNSRAWNDALKLSSGDPVVFAADDLEWQPGWLDAALAKLAEFDGGWGLVGFNDGHWDAELSTHYLMSRRFIVEVLGGVVAWEHYPHSFNDLEVNARARAAGRYAWCEDAKVFHRHWLFGDRPQDETDTRTLEHHAAAQEVYRRRVAEGFPTDYDPVIES